MRFWNQEQASQFIQATKGTRFYALYLLALTTGMRLGELLALKWQDIDFTNSSLSVQRIAYEISGKIHIGEPKTAKGRRKIELPIMTIRALEEHKTAMSFEKLESLWVFCDSIGGLCRQSNIRRRSFEPLLISAGVPKIRFHDLRHTAATLLLSQGVHPKVVQERLGHAQISMTLDTYSHMLPSLQKEAALKLNALLDLGAI